MPNTIVVRREAILLGKGVEVWRLVAADERVIVLILQHEDENMFKVEQWSSKRDCSLFSCRLLNCRLRWAFNGYYRRAASEHYQQECEPVGKVSTRHE